jgi:hypothetical protein
MLVLHSKGLKGKDVPDVVENEERMYRSISMKWDSLEVMYFIASVVISSIVSLVIFGVCFRWDEDEIVMQV